MKLRLNLNYKTIAGEDLRVNVKQADGTFKEYAMQSADSELWTVAIDHKAASGGCVEYYYSVHRLKTTLRREWQMMAHRLELSGASGSSYTCHDIWYDMPEDSFLYSSAFTRCIHRRELSAMPSAKPKKPLCLKVRAPQLRRGEQLRLVGDDQTLGSWDICHSVQMYEHEDNEWVVTIDVGAVRRDAIEFKFIIVNEDAEKNVIWEEGMNRVLALPHGNGREIVVHELHHAHFNIPDQKFAGTAVPLFSLRSEGSFGVGDFGDLKLMIDWVNHTGQRVLQLLPINDTTLTHKWTDSYPYACVSIYALHPMYCDFRQLPPLEDGAKGKAFAMKRIELNALSQIDYEAVNNAKNEYLHLLFEQEGKAVLATEEYKKWFAEEQQWLVPYAQYCVLRDQYGTCDYSQWPSSNQWDEAARKALTSTRTKAYAAASFFYYVQFVLAKQMKAAHEHARKSNVVLKGDIPIGVHRHGSDAWMEPRYFNLNGQTGAPPDDFSKNGQNWGFPTYNWDEMLKDDCQWWVRRFSNMAKYFDAYRIDHVLGFFRIWEIPTHSVHGLLGQFQPSLGLTVSEIEEYGLKWDEEMMLEPFITDWVVDRWFGEKADYARETFLEPTHDDRYRLKEEFNTQRKVEAYFQNRLDIDAINMRDTLYALISNVLFLRDHKVEDKYHPRISAQLDPCYEALWDTDKDAFNNLYNDYFYRRNNHFWYLEAMKKMPRLVNATRMLVCAEDLGMVPDCVPWVINELRILSLEIQSMPKDPGCRFGHLSRNPYRSVCTISSHDTATLRMWWDEDQERTQEYYRTMLHRGNDAPHPMPGWLARDIIYRHLACPSMLCILTLQDWLATDEKLRLTDAGAERINIPANPKHYWRYRMHISLEKLLKADELNYTIAGIIKETYR